MTAQSSEFLFKIHKKVFTNARKHAIIKAHRKVIEKERGSV